MNEERPELSITVDCELCELTECLGGRDLDDRVHRGFTLGSRGRRLYWYICWHPSGNATVYGVEGTSLSGRWVKGYQPVRVFFK